MLPSYYAHVATAPKRGVAVQHRSNKNARSAHEWPTKRALALRVLQATSFSERSSSSSATVHSVSTFLRPNVEYVKQSMPDSQTCTAGRSIHLPCAVSHMEKVLDRVAEAAENNDLTSRPPTKSPQDPQEQVTWPLV